MWWLPVWTKGPVHQPEPPQQLPSLTIQTVLGTVAQGRPKSFSWNSPMSGNLEGDFNCRYDVISVYDGPSTNYRLLGKLCGGQSSTFYSTGSSITVQFTSDDSSTYKGFQGEYHVVDGGSCRYICGYQVGNCSCSSSCEYRGDCCQDYQPYCPPPHQIFQPHQGLAPPVEETCMALVPSPVPTFQNITMTTPTVYGTYQPPLAKGPSCRLLTWNELRFLFRNGSCDYPGRVYCSSDNMNIVIQRSYLISMGYDAYNLFLNDQHLRSTASRWCSVSRSTSFENGRVDYTNAVRAYRSDSGEITHQSHFMLRVECRMEQDTMVQIMYKAKHDGGNSTITGMGRFNVTMAFFPSSNFYTQIAQTPYEITLNQNLYIHVRLRRSDSSLHLFLDTCMTSPSPHDFQTRSYDLVRNGCRRNLTYYSYTSGTSGYACFTFQAFKFLRATDYNSRCRRGSRTHKARDPPRRATPWS
ncbi:unnamed protein product, partial [Coregonus sp. 'balchen']